jgi:hypothetical protein
MKRDLKVLLDDCFELVSLLNRGPLRDFMDSKFFNAFDGPFK